MHSVIVAACFLLIIVLPCVIGIYSLSKEGHSGNTGEHEVASPQVIAAAGEKAARTNRPSRIRMAADAVFNRQPDSSKDPQPSRIQRVAAALRGEPQKPVPMASGDPGAPRQSIRELRAKQAAARSNKTT